MGVGGSVGWGIDIHAGDGVGSVDGIKFGIYDWSNMGSFDGFFYGSNDGQTCGLIFIWITWIKWWNVSWYLILSGMLMLGL